MPIYEIVQHCTSGERYLLELEVTDDAPRCISCLGPIAAWDDLPADLRDAEWADGADDAEWADQQQWVLVRIQ